MTEINIITIRHITHEGIYAGVPYCGIDRDKFPNDLYHHAGKWLENPTLNVCMACRDIHNEAGDK